MRHGASQALYAYWNEVRRGRTAPRRLDIQPARIADLLLDTFILERTDPASFRFRLVGSRVAARFSSDLRNQAFLSCWSGRDRAMLEHHLAAITDLGRAGLFTCEAMPSACDLADVTTPATFEMLVLPLTHAGDSIDRLLGLIVPLDDEAAIARAHIDALKLCAAEAIWPAADSAADHLADRQSPLGPHVRMARIVRQGRRQFRVYDGGRTSHETR